MKRRRAEYDAFFHEQPFMGKPATRILGEPNRKPFPCPDCGVPVAYNQGRHVVDAERGRMVVCRDCKSRRDSAA